MFSKHINKPLVNNTPGPMVYTPQNSIKKPEPEKEKKKYKFFQKNIK